VVEQVEDALEGKDPDARSIQAGVGNQHVDRAGPVIGTLPVVRSEHLEQAGKVVGMDLRRPGLAAIGL
jgi:hypothetical protein